MGFPNYQPPELNYAESKTAAKDFKEKHHHHKDYHKSGVAYALSTSQKWFD